MKLGEGLHRRGVGKAGGSKVLAQDLSHSTTNKGVRAEGGGRKNPFLDVWQLAKAYRGVERLLDHHSEPADVYQQFDDQV